MMEIRDFIGLGISGILGLMWFEIKGVRQNKAGYLTEEKHDLLSENAMLRVEKKIDDMKDEILEAIRENNK